VQPELAVGLPAAGAVCTAVLRSRPQVALASGALLGLAATAVLFFATPGITSVQLGVSLALTSPGRALLIAAAASLGLAVALAPARVERAALLTWGLVGLAGMTAIVAVPSLDLAILVLLMLGVLHAGLTGRRGFASRLRAPVFAVAVIGVALAFSRVQGPDLLTRFAGIGLVAGLAAGIGLLPFIHEFDPEEGAVASPIPWIAFLGPLLAAAIIGRSRELLPPDAGGVFGAMLIGLGLINMLWGSLASWRTENGAAAWQYSFMADWGLAMCGFGLAITDGQAAAMLVLFSIVLSRLPLYLWSRQALREKTTTDRPVNLLMAAVLAGSAPFAGFPARVLLLRGATQIYWPLALVLALAMLLWLPPSLRLGRSLGLPRGRQAVGVGIVLVINLALGIYPQPVLGLAGL
jgi:hypothetical protein